MKVFQKNHKDNGRYIIIYIYVWKRVEPGKIRFFAEVNHIGKGIQLDDACGARNGALTTLWEAVNSKMQWVSNESWG